MSWVDRVWFVLITGFGTGLAPVASGTFGTLPAVGIGLLMQQRWQGVELAVALAVLALVLLGIGCAATGFVKRQWTGGDPGAFVLDEIVGYLITLALLCCFTDPTLMAHGAAFLLFRLFDVIKPWPANRLEYIPGAPGIMLDDVMAGVYAGLGLIVLWFLELL